MQITTELAVALFARVGERALSPTPAGRYERLILIGPKAQVRRALYSYGSAGAIRRLPCNWVLDPEGYAWCAEPVPGERRKSHAPTAPAHRAIGNPTTAPISAPGTAASQMAARTTPGRGGCA